jgi:hypothetical protein
MCGVQIEEIEKQIGCGQVEELIEQVRFRRAIEQVNSNLIIWSSAGKERAGIDP